MHLLRHIDNTTIVIIDRIVEITRPAKGIFAGIKMASTMMKYQGRALL